MLLTGIDLANMAAALVPIRRLLRQSQDKCLRNTLIGALFCRLLLEICFMAAHHLPQPFLERVLHTTFSPNGITLDAAMALSPLCMFLNFTIIITAWRYRKAIPWRKRPTQRALLFVLWLCPLEILPALCVLLLPITLPVGAFALLSLIIQGLLTLFVVCWGEGEPLALLSMSVRLLRRLTDTACGRPLGRCQRGSGLLCCRCP